MTTVHKLVLGWAFILQLSIASAYEIDTHARITYEAYRQSALAQQSSVERLGLWKSRKREQLTSINEPPIFTARLASAYFDLLNQPTSRNAREFDHHNHRYDNLANGPIRRWRLLVENGTPAPYFIGDWLSRGAVREDDQSALITNFLNGPFWGDPYAWLQLDTNNPINRFCNHFYDPVNNRALQMGLPLSLFACGSGEVFGSAVQWSLGSSSVDGLASADTSRKNSFSLLDAREAMWRALTGTDGNNAPVPLANSRAGRDAYWATTFRALGGVVHNLQDMGQPQHTRNEAHAFGQGHLLEEHVNNRILGIGPRAGQSEAGVAVQPPIDFGNYPVPMFATARQFFSTASGSASYSGLGLANYSNRGFFTHLSNFGNSTYTMPDSNPANYGLQTVTTAVVQTNDSNQGYQFDEIYLTRSVPDLLNPSQQPEPIKMARDGLLKDVIDEYGLATPAAQYRYSIDRRVIDDQVSRLIPRAVAYSTGMINFFFRGSLEIKPSTDGIFGVVDHASGTGFTKLVLKVKNTTAAITDPVTNAVVTQQMNPGRFVAVVRFHRDLAFSNDLSTAIGLGACNNLAAIYGAGNEPTAAGHDPTLSTACRDGNETMVTSAPRIDTLDPDEEKEMPFDFSASPIPLAGVDYSVQVVYRGKLGYEDDAVATGFREMADPMFITRHNIYDYIMHGTDGTATNRNEFGAAIPSAEFPTPTNFYRANRHRFDFAGLSDFRGYGYPGLSYFGMESFVAFDYTQTMNYRYTFGPRNVAAVATATAIAPGGFTRIAVLVPLWKPNSIVETPPVRIERQRFAESAYMGETVDLWPHRHATQQVAWQAPMRGNNSWHSDGFVWHLPPMDAELALHLRYCEVGPRTELQLSRTQSTTTNGVSATPYYRLTNSGDVFYREVRLDGSLVRPEEQICGANRRSPLTPPPNATSWLDFANSFYYTQGAWTTSYSPWDVLLTTNNYSHRETPTGWDQYFSSAVELPFANNAKLSLDGITQTAILGKAPTPVTIAQKYR